ISRKGLRQWAAVRRTRGLNTRAEQKPALSPPRIKTIATRSAKRLSGSAPTSARAGASGAASAATIASDRIVRARGGVIGGLHAPERAALQSLRRPPPAPQLPYSHISNGAARPFHSLGGEGGR